MWDFMMEYILPIIIIIFLLMASFIIGLIIFLEFKNEFKSLNYIQNIETKLNIYEQSYDNFVLEDSLNQ